MDRDRLEVSTQDVRKSSYREGVSLRFLGRLAFSSEVTPIDFNENILSFSWVDSKACIKAPEIGSLPTWVPAVEGPLVAMVSRTLLYKR